MLTKFFNTLEIGLQPKLCLEIGYLERDANFKSVLVYALDHFLGRVKVKNVVPEIYTVEIANIVDDLEKFKTLSQIENALSFVKTCRKENSEFIKTKVGNKQGLAVRGLDR